LFTVDNFWEILTAASGETVNGMTEVLNSLAKDSKAKAQLYFDLVLGGAPPGNESDWLRLRSFFLDWYAAHQTISSATSQITDPRTLSNPDLDELFRSFGYNYSTQLKGPDTNPIDLKVNFFLDLVNLYKRKGTPQALVEILQYYGVTKLDIYEFFIKLQSANSLIFEGSAIAGTSSNPSKLIFEYDKLTSDDPHWLYTEEQILQIHRTNNINLPSKTPYLGIRPVASIDGSEISILVRLVQDQFQYYLDNGIPPTANAEVSEFGEVVSLLELYLSILYIFIKQYNIGQIGDNFICYDGSNVNITSIIEEFESITTKPTTRAGILTGLASYYDTFSREAPRNFLQNQSDAETYLTAINPALKILLDGSTLTDSELLFSLMKDLSSWIRINLGYGFINMGFIMFGLDSFFDDLKPVINFFKPYRARLLLLELLQISNPLLNTIIVEDTNDTIKVEFPIHDYITGNGNPCCTEENIDATNCCTICLNDSTTVLYYQRETYDCNSYHDIGATTDIGQNDFFPFIEDTHRSTLVCIPPDMDSTSIVHNEVINGEMTQDGTATIFVVDSTSVPIWVYNELMYEEETDGGFADFDEPGTFDCPTSCDRVYIEVYQGSSSSSSTSSSSSSSSVSSSSESSSSSSISSSSESSSSISSSSSSSSISSSSLSTSSSSKSSSSSSCSLGYTETAGPTNWEPSLGSWSAGKYSSASDQLILDTTGSLWVDWRPSRIKITFDNSDSLIYDIHAFDESNNLIMERMWNTNVTNPVEFQTIFTEPYNLSQLRILDTLGGNPFEVTNLQFYDTCKERLISTVSDGTDDGWAYVDGSNYTPNGDFNRMGLGYTASTNVMTWYRFKNVQIPQGATINGAHLRWNAYSNSVVASVNLYCYCEDSTSTIAPISGADLISRPLTTTSVWKVISTPNGGWVQNKWYLSSEFSSVLQEIVDKGGWSSGNALTVYYIENGGTSTTAANRASKSYDFDPNYAVELWVDWTP